MWGDNKNGRKLIVVSHCDRSEVENVSGRGEDDDRVKKGNIFQWKKFKSIMFQFI